VIDVVDLKKSDVMTPYVYSRNAIMLSNTHSTPTARADPVERRVKKVNNSTTPSPTAKATVGSISLFIEAIIE
jgi:hypothetical protein